MVRFFFVRYISTSFYVQLTIIKGNYYRNVDLNEVDLRTSLPEKVNFAFEGMST